MGQSGILEPTSPALKAAAASLLECSMQGIRVATQGCDVL